MNNLTHLKDGWNAGHEWHKRHESGLFGMVVKVHGEKAERDSLYSPPRMWCSYLIGGDQCRWYRGEISERWVDPDKVTDLVVKHGSALFDSLDWNGGQTFFQVQTITDSSHSGWRLWKVGDDYQHLWDSESGRWDWYDFEHVSRNIKHVADQFAEKLKLLL